MLLLGVFLPPISGISVEESCSLHSKHLFHLKSRGSLGCIVYSQVSLCLESQVNKVFVVFHQIRYNL